MAVRQIQADLRDATGWRTPPARRSRRPKADAAVVDPWRKAAQLLGLGADVIDSQQSRRRIAATPDAVLLHDSGVVGRSLVDLGDLLRVVSDAYPLVHSACARANVDLDDRLDRIAPIMVRVAARCEFLRRGPDAASPSPLEMLRLPHSFDLDHPELLTRLSEQPGFVRGRLFGWEDPRRL